MQHSHKALLCALAAAFAAPAFAQDDFRVTPYLMNPSDSGVALTWFTESAGEATLTVSGGDLASPLTFNSNGAYQSNLEYTTNEFDDALNRGYPVFSDQNYKHRVDLNGMLSPNQTYTYSVDFGASTYNNAFRTAPTASDWTKITFASLADSETEPRGNNRFRDWRWPSQAPGSLGRGAAGLTDTSNYLLTETQGYSENLRYIQSYNADFINMPGDLVQGGGYQIAWDEFFRHNAGSFDDPLGSVPLLPALGNWENFGAQNGGYAPQAVFDARQKFKTYFDAPANNTPQHQNQYYRVDYGPVTMLTLDSSNGLPDGSRSNPNGDADTQENVSEATYPGDDLADFNPGSPQWDWAMAQLADARSKGQLIFVQFHHTPYSSGVHGFPLSDPRSSGQGGTPMRVYSEAFEKYGVLGVFTGHSELAERSYIDLDGDGIGFFNFDTGVGGDGVRGEHPYNGQPRTNANPFNEWTADENEPELWGLNEDGEVVLLEGGRHYGHVKTNIIKLDDGTIIVDFIYMHVFPLTDVDDNGDLIVVGTELRPYSGGGRQLIVGSDGRLITVVPEPATLALIALGALGALVLWRKRR